MMQHKHLNTDVPQNPGIRFYIGLGVLILSVFMLPIGIFLQQFFTDHFWRVFVLAVFWASAPIMKVSSIVILGKPSYLWIKYKFWHVFVKVARPKKVSRLRYNIGLVMFCLPIIPNYIMSFAPMLIADVYPTRLIINICIDAIFIGSLFVLGGDFWDKLRALFTYTAKVKFEVGHKVE
jgi:hypothetical protein